MGRTIRSATQTWMEEEKALGRFARALRKEITCNDGAH
jgi:hypothetical protein